MGYALVAGMLVRMPYNPQMMQSWRNLFYHVPMWFALLTLMGISLYHSIRLLRSLDPDAPAGGAPLIHDARAAEAARIGVLLNCMGLATGIIWSRVTWGENMDDGNLSAWWGWDPIQVCALISLLIYGAYYLLRSSFSEPLQRARVAAVYNIFAFATLIPLYFIIPRMLDGLHPTAGKGSFIFNRGGVTPEMRAVLYPGMFGFILLSVWVYELRARMAVLQIRMEEKQALITFNRQSQL